TNWPTGVRVIVSGRWSVLVRPAGLLDDYQVLSAWSGRRHSIMSGNGMAGGCRLGGSDFDDRLCRPRQAPFAAVGGEAGSCPRWPPRWLCLASVHGVGERGLSRDARWPGRR